MRIARLGTQISAFDSLPVPWFWILPAVRARFEREEIVLSSTAREYEPSVESIFGKILIYCLPRGMWLLVKGDNISPVEMKPPTKPGLGKLANFLF